MPAQDRTLDAYRSVMIVPTTISTTGTAETSRIAPPTGLVGSLLQKNFLTASYPVNEVWVPVAVSYQISTTTTVTAPVLTLRKNGVTSTVGGSFTVPVAAASATAYTMAPLSDWTGGFASGNNAGDLWSLIVTTSSTAGAIGPVILWYACRAVTGVTDGPAV